MPLGDGDDEHEVGNPECRTCWGWNHPYEHEDCEGLVHASFGEQLAPDAYTLVTVCDVCGQSP
jgi:hypothetical protein